MTPIEKFEAVMNKHCEKAKNGNVESMAAIAGGIMRFHYENKEERGNVSGIRTGETDVAAALSMLILICTTHKIPPFHGLYQAVSTWLDVRDRQIKTSGRRTGHKTQEKLIGHYLKHPDNYLNDSETNRVTGISRTTIRKYKADPAWQDWFQRESAG